MMITEYVTSVEKTFQSEYNLLQDAMFKNQYILKLFVSLCWFFRHFSLKVLHVECLIHYVAFVSQHLILL